MRDTRSEAEGGTPLYGRWSFDFVAQTWHWSQEMMAMYAADLSNPGDVELVFSRLHPDDRDVIRDRLDHALATGSAISGQYRFNSPRRGQRTFSFVGTPVIDETGRVVKLDGFTIDVTSESASAARQAVDGATQSRAAIEQVKGALMATYGMSEDFAFEALRHLSMHHNVKLSTLAAEVVDRLSSDGVGLALVTSEPGHGRIAVPVIEVLQKTAAELGSAHNGRASGGGEETGEETGEESSRAN